MRGKTVKRLRVYVNFLKQQDAQLPLTERKFEQFTHQNMGRQVKRLWRKDKVFQEFIKRAIRPKNDVTA